MASDVLLTTVPEQLKRLVRLIVRGFYGVEHSLVIDMLVRHPCVKEDDLAELLKFERKHLRSVLNSLKIDKFLKSRMRVETDEEGRTTRHTFYFINYSVFVNVVKYKLDHMRRKIETDERDSTSRSTFKCAGCEKTYTDLEVGQLFDIGSRQLVCTFCQNTVEEDERSIPKQNVRTVLARFNEQIEVIYDLLRECEDFKLAPEVLDPEPTDIKKVMSQTSAGAARKALQDGDKTVWSGDATRKVGFGFSENRVTITMDDENAGKVEKRDQPIWMTKSTVDGATPVEALNHDSKVPEPEKRGRGGGTDDILQTLLVHEPKAGPSRIGAPESSDGDSDADELKNGEDVEEMDSDEFEDAGPFVSIGTSRVPYNSINSDMVANMTPLEKEEYIRIGQQLYENIYD
uniref:General transcription factor IIE subunit 1 n=1 Tax=Arion vulgaris TaxID=1028688 RepID=A0A0B6ZR75_9EUPU